ncbi:MAG: hypothetical protein ACN4GZ_15050, partial [Acidimicrobiales bacterium]
GEERHGMFRAINDLPAHVLFVHLPVVAIPVMSLLAVLMGIIKRPPVWLQRIVVGGTALTVAATWFAVRSGREFDKIIGDRVNTDRHEALANRTMLLVTALAISVGGLGYVISRLGNDQTPRPAGLIRARFVLSLATIALATLSTIWIVRTGEEGARITWRGVVPVEADG